MGASVGRLPALEDLICNKPSLDRGLLRLTAELIASTVKHATSATLLFTAISHKGWFPKAAFWGRAPGEQAQTQRDRRVARPRPSLQGSLAWPLAKQGTEVSDP